MTPVELQQRMRRVRLLLSTANDPYQLVRREPGSSGPAPSRRVPCKACSAGRPCPLCGGSGWRLRRKGEQEYDEYLGEPVATAERNLRMPPRKFYLNHDIVRLSEEIERLARVDDPGEDMLTRALRRREWLERRGSYRELRRSLGELRRRSECVYDVLARLYLANVDVRPDGRTTAIESLGVQFLAQDMRGEIRVPHQLEESQSTERQMSVEELAGRGYSARRIAKILRAPLKVVKDRLRS